MNNPPPLRHVPVLTPRFQIRPRELPLHCRSSRRLSRPECRRRYPLGLEYCLADIGVVTVTGRFLPDLPRDSGSPKDGKVRPHILPALSDTLYAFRRRRQGSSEESQIEEVPALL